MTRRGEGGAACGRPRRAPGGAGGGEWVVAAGLPAKGGVGGGVMAGLPGQVGPAFRSPRLDRHGNSVRGVAACRQMSRELELHFLHVTSDRRSAIRASWDVGAA